MPTELSNMPLVASTLRALKSFAKGGAVLDYLFIVSGLICSLLITVAYINDPGRPPLWLFVLVALVTFKRPVWGLSAFIFLLPVLGNRPTTRQFQLLLMMSAMVNTTLAIKYLWAVGTNKNGEIQKAVFRHPLMLMVLIYFLASLASLTSLPWKQLLLDFQASGGISLSLIPQQVRTFLTVNEASYAYSILTVLLTFQAILIAFFIHAYIQRSSRNSIYFCISLLAGLLLTLLAGALDFYHFINLEWLRPLDPNINPGGVQVRLQSFWGHSGWLAEYIVLTVPYALILLLSKDRSSIRVLLIFFILMLGEYITVLTYQRGGWITYAVTLLLVAISVYLIRYIKDGGAQWALMKRSALKALIPLVLIFVLPLAVIYLVNRAERVAGNERISTEQYAGRLIEIKNVWERAVFFRAGLRLGLLHPFLGGGSEGFDFLYKREFLEPQGSYFNDPIELGTLHSTAHNVYMQTFSGKGLWGLSLLLLPILYLIASGLRLLKEPGITYQNRLIILISVCSCCAFLVYGHMQEFFYIPSLQYIFFITLALFSASLSAHLSLASRYTGILWIFLAVGLIAHLGWEYGLPGSARKMWQGRPEFGCYDAEMDKVVGRFNWCGQSFRQSFPVSSPDGQPVALLNIGISNPKPDPRLVNLRVELAAHEVAGYQLQPNARYFLPIVIPPSLRSLVQNQSVPLKVIGDNLFNPAYDIAGSKDYRFLSIMKYEAAAPGTQDFRLCGPLEVWENGKGHWCNQNNLLPVAITDVGQPLLKLSIRVPHPDASLSPVSVTLGQLGYTYRQYTLSNNEWTTIELPINAEKLTRDNGQPPTLQLYVNSSRLWNPMKAAGGSDNRDLGVAILSPD